MTGVGKTGRDFDGVSSLRACKNMSFVGRRFSKNKVIVGADLVDHSLPQFQTIMEFFRVLCGLGPLGTSIAQDDAWPLERTAIYRTRVCAPSIPRTVARVEGIRKRRSALA